LNDSEANSRNPKPLPEAGLGSARRLLVGCVFALFLAVQAAPGQTPPSQPTKPGQELMEPGDEVDGNVIEQRSPTVPGVGIPGRSAKGAKAAKAPQAAAEPPRWGVVLATFSDEGHAQMAKTACERLAESYPQLKGCYARSTDRGSVVFFGQFTGPKEDDARAALEMVKAISPDGRARPFGRAYLSRARSSSDQGRSPNDLRMAARRKLPGVEPVFTFQVAMWSDFDSRTMAQDEIERRAEEYCGSLRGRGVEAYVHHDEDKHMSIVTVGVFDSTAYDPRSTLFSPAVEKLFKQFPTMLVNGEQLLVPPPRGSAPDTPPTPQTCVLIEVPK
jgi:hypothetical protein